VLLVRLRYPGLEAGKITPTHLTEAYPTINMV
jgi:hypothetical protein